MSNPLPLREPERSDSQPDDRPEIVSLPARTADLGGGLIVVRTLPMRQHRLIGPWCFFDQFGPLSFTDRKPMDVAPHPHIGLQTVSWLFSGEILHNDSLGSEGLVRPGELNLMTAGAGIAHSEQTPEQNAGQLHGIQLWVALPEAERQCEPDFSHYVNLPILEPGGGRARVFLGELDGVRSPGRAFSPLVGAELEIGANGKLRIPLKPDWEHALVMIDGAAMLDGVRLSPGALHYLGTRREGMELAAKDAARAILIGGEPFGESIIMWWNFVARTEEEIRQARDEWQTRRHFGEVRAYSGVRLAAPPFNVHPIASR
jgi:redox-sensitive bicupin YhaK (pirin superfamily)